MSQPNANSGFLATLLGVVTILSALLVLFVWTGRWDDQVRAHLQDRIASYWPNLKVTIASARYVAGKGFEIRGLRLRQRPRREDGTNDSEDTASQVIFDEILISCTNQLTELLANRVEIRGILCKRPNVRIVYDKRENWSLQDWYPVTGSLHAPFPIHIQQGTVEIVDRHVAPERTMTLRDLQGLLRPTVLPDSTRIAWQFEASVAGDLVRRGVASGQVLAANHWSAQIALTDVAISSQLSVSLPAAMAHWFPPMESFQATCGITMQAGQQPDWKSAVYRVTGRFRDGRLVDPRLVHPLKDVQGEFEVDPQRAVVRNLTAQYANAVVEGNACFLTGSANGSQVAGIVKGLTLEEAIQRVLPGTLSDAYQAFQPAGDVDASWQFIHDGTRWVPAGEIRCRNVSFAWRKFPLPVERVTGNLQYQRDRLVIDVMGSCANRPVTIRGDIERPGANWTGWCEYKTSQPMPLDDRLLAALPDRFSRGLRTLTPRGSFQIDGRASRQYPGEKVVFHSLIEITEGTVRPVLFPYFFQDLRGRVEQQAGHWKIHELTGRNDSATFRARGDWSIKDPAGAVLQLQLSAKDVAFEDELRSALSPVAQRLWRQLRPQGVMDAIEVDYYLDTAARQKRLQIVMDSRNDSDASSANTVSLQPRAFPYRLDDVTGKAFYRDGKIRLAGLRASHGRVLFAADGTALITPDGQWDLEFADLLADRCRPDRELLTALPPRLRRVLEQLRATGEVCLHGQLRLHGQAGNPLQSRSQWDLALDIADATATAGVVLKNISGEARVSGHADPQKYYCQGGIMLDSLMADRVHCTRVQGPIWIDQDRIFLGDWSQFQQVHPAIPSTPDRMTPVHASVFGGQTFINAEIVPARDGAFDVQVKIDGMKLDQLSRDLAFAHGPTRGNAGAEFRLEGDARGTATWRGSGKLVVRDTDLYRLPVTLALLKQLRTGSRDRTAFDAADVAVRMQGQHLYFDRLDLHGDAVTLKGVGEMSLRRDLNLNFYTMMGREDSYLPALRPFLGLASQRFLLVRVEGTLDQPVTSREILPAINDTLEQMFPELSTRPQAPRPSVVRTVSGP